ncbi:choice-of-anchor D domain-containing protein [bacterium]|nr:choice-of-anchor D domain-containing protein [bacterium]
MYTFNRVFFLLSFLSLGCTSDYNLQKPLDNPEPGESLPEIEVTPVEHSFGALSAGSETQIAIITIKNIGHDTLEVLSTYLQSGTSNFSLVALPDSEIEPGETTEIFVEYSPGTYETNSDIISIASNDADESIVDVYLDGSGDAPIITIDPDYFSFSSVFLGCDDTVPVQIGNIGNSNLIISDMEFFASIPADFSMDDYEAAWGPLPITIPPGGVIDAYVNYTPVDEHDDSAYIEINSNDPATPVAYADQDGIGDYESYAIDAFVQDGIVDVDILFVVDNSGSMNSNQTNLKNNFDSFINAFSIAGASYHIGIITTDQDELVGDVITETTSDPIAEFNSQIDSIGTHGSAHEKGLWYAYESTTTGDASPGSSSGFFRPSARLVVVYISDEPDWSHQTYSGGGSMSMTPSDYVASLISLKTSPALIVAHAIAGDYPSGCSGNGGAQFGEGYYEVVNSLGGTFMSICATDWSATMDTLARESIAMTEFPLSGNPIESTIEVRVDGIVSTDWVYTSSSNSIAFLVVPSEGSEILIDYANWGCR